MEVLIDKDGEGRITGVSAMRGTPLVAIDPRLQELPPEQQALNVVLAALFRARRHANEYRAIQGHKGEDMFHGAAIAGTRDGRSFLGVNRQIVTDYTWRLCAEFNAVSSFDQLLDRGDDLVTDIWFVGARANYEKNIALLDGEEGRRAVPCASCLCLLNRVNPDMNVHLLPAFDPARHLISPYTGRPLASVAEDEVFTARAGDMFRHSVLEVTGRENMESLRRASEFLFGAHEAEHVCIPDSDACNRTINDYMMCRLRGVCAKAGPEDQEVQLAVLRMDDGSLFEAAYVENGRTTPPALSLAIYTANAIQTPARVREVFYTEFRTGALKALLDGSSPGSFALSLPDGTAIERLRKNAAGPDNNADIHILVPNDPAHFDPIRHMRTYQLMDVTPLRFVGTKEARANGHAHIGGGLWPG